MENRELEKRALYYKAVENYRSTEKSKHEDACHFLLEASDLGSPEADKLLGILYMSGQYAPYPEKDMTKALACYERAAAAGDEEAMFWISQCYEMGLGVEKNDEIAAEWKEKALAAGFVPAESEDEAQEVLSELPEEEMKELPEETEAASQQEVPVPKEQQPEIEKKPRNPFKQRMAQQSRTFSMNRSDEAPQKRPLEIEDIMAYEGRLRKLADDNLRSTPLRYALFTGGIVFASILLISLIVYLIVRPEEGARTFYLVFWIMILIIALGVSVLGGWIGWNKGKDKAVTENSYTLSAFHIGFRGKEPAEGKDSWLYRMYKVLKRGYIAVKVGHPVKPEKIYRADYDKKYGFFMPGWIYKTKRGYARPEFVICTEKAVYVVHCPEMKGRLSGDLRDPQWVLRMDNMGGQQENAIEIRQTVMVPNLVEENEYALGIVRSDLQLTNPLSIENIPYFNVILFPSDLDVRGIRFVGAGENVILLQGGAEKLRAQINMRESMLPFHGVDMREFGKLLDEVGRKQAERHGEMASQAADNGGNGNSSFHAMNINEFR